MRSHHLDKRATAILAEVGNLPDQLLLTTEQIANLAGTSKAFWERLRCEGGGPRYVTLGRAIRYRAGDYKAWIADRVRRSTGAGSIKRAPALVEPEQG